MTVMEFRMRELYSLFLLGISAAWPDLYVVHMTLGVVNTKKPAALSSVPDTILYHYIAILLDIVHYLTSS
jgi:hypothetical protein